MKKTLILILIEVWALGAIELGFHLLSITPQTQFTLPYGVHVPWDAKDYFCHWNGLFFLTLGVVSGFAGIIYKSE
jgi:hypothetical protein